MPTLVQSPRRSKTASGDRLKKLRQKQIDYIPNDQFEDLPPLSTAVEAILSDECEKSSSPASLPAHLKRMCATEILTSEQEQILFREMNYLKFLAAKLQEELNSQDVDVQLIDDFEALMAKAERIRDHLVKANMRLVMSVVKRFVTPQQSFDEMLSDGVMILMNAVEKFDFARGFRFSTYAYRSIARYTYRSVTTYQKEAARFTRDADEWAFEQPADQSISERGDQLWDHLRGLMSNMLQHLDRRERFIIRSRYALGAHRKVRTFQYLADKLGVSKERARQLERRAVSKMQAMAGKLNTDDLLAATI